jgi:hypothetical protein
LFHQVASGAVNRYVAETDDDNERDLDLRQASDWKWLSGGVVFDHFPARFEPRKTLKARKESHSPVRAFRAFRGSWTWLFWLATTANPSHTHGHRADRAASL